MLLEKKLSGGKKKGNLWNQFSLKFSETSRKEPSVLTEEDVVTVNNVCSLFLDIY